MNIIEKPSRDYFLEETRKLLLVHHFTAGGTLAGSEATLAIPDKVSVHYQVDRDGQPFRYFPEKYWSYSTGMGARHDKKVISIEWVCWGPLTRKGNVLYSWTGKKIPWSEAIRLPKWRGYEYWHILTPAQIETAKWLQPDIISRWPGMTATTHAAKNPRKLDFPPGYPTIQELVA